VLTFAYARREIVGIAAAGAAATAVVGHLLGWWGLLPAAVAGLLLSFYRHPRRVAPIEPGIILAPADGKVVEILPQAAGPDEERPVVRLTIFLRIYDVHVNRSPCGGRVVRVSYRPGRFLNALRAAASVENECSVITLEPDAPLPGPIQVRQIAGALARRRLHRARRGAAGGG